MIPRKTKNTGVTILASDKIDFKPKTITREKEDHYIMIKRAMQQEEIKEITFINIYASSRETPKYIKQILTVLKGEIDSNTIIVGDFNVFSNG